MVNTDILNILDPVEFDTSITSAEFHTYLPYASAAFGTDDEIRIPIQNQDAYTLPSESLLVIEGKLVRGTSIAAGTDFPASTKFSINGFAHLFSDIRYELNGVTIDQTRNPGISSTMKYYASATEAEKNLFKSNGWENDQVLKRNTGYFCVSVPLKHLLGFCEDFKKIIVNMRQELILIRANTNTNVYETDAANNDVTLKLTRVFWRVPHVTVSDEERLKLLHILKNDPWLSVPFMTWELHEYPALNTTDHHTWSVKTAPRFESPRYIILGFQTDRKNSLTKNASSFDHLKLTNAKAYLNGIPYPYDNLNLSITDGQYLPLYHMYAQFQSSYYHTNGLPMKSYKDFLEQCPLVVFDCSRQEETVKSGSVDIRLEWTTKDAVAASTAAYCLILHDRVVNYRPLTALVQIL